MKYILLIISFIGSFALADVVVTESARVLKDGSDIGAVPDAIMNKVVTPSEVQAALLKLIVSMKADREAAQTAALAATADKAAIVEAVTKDDKRAITAALKTDKQRRKDEIQARIDAARKELEDADK